MPVNYRTPAPEELLPVAGVRLGVAAAAIRKLDRHDLTLLALDAGSRVACSGGWRNQCARSSNAA